MRSCGHTLIVCLTAAFAQLNVQTAVGADLQELRSRAYELGTNQHRLSEAIPLLEQAIQSDPGDTWTRDLLGRYYYDHAASLAKQKRYKDAYAAFNRYFAKYPKDPDDWWRACTMFEDATAAQYLYPLFSEYAKRFPEHRGVTAVAPKVRLNSQIARSGKSAATRDSFDSMIVYRNPGHPDVSTAFYGVVKEGLRTIPSSVWQKLSNYGCRVMLAPHVVDVMSEKANQHPRGYKEGKTYRNVPAIYFTERKYITIAEFYFNEEGKELRNNNPAETACHETGHAFDDCLGHLLSTSSTIYPLFSHGEEFSAAYAKDIPGIPVSDHARLHYYLQSGKAGQEELFAELFSIFFDQSAQVQGSDDELIERCFPHSIALMKSKLGIK